MQFIYIFTIYSSIIAYQLAYCEISVSCALPSFPSVYMASNHVMLSNLRGGILRRGWRIWPIRGSYFLSLVKAAYHPKVVRKKWTSIASLYC